MKLSRIISGSVAFALATTTALPAAPRPSWLSQRMPLSTAKPAIVKRVPLRGGQTATVYTNGIETLTNAKGKVTRRALVPIDSFVGDATQIAPSQGELLKPLLFARRPSRPYVPNELIVVFAAGVAPASDNVKISMHAAHSGSLHQFSNSYAANTAFARIGTDSVTRIASKIDRSTLTRMRGSMSAGPHPPALDLGSAYVMHFTNAPLQRALEQLRKTPGIAYVEPNFYVSTMHVTPLIVSPHAVAASHARALSRGSRNFASSTPGFAPHSIPANYAVSTGAQSMLDASSLNDVTAFDLIKQNFNQLPGQGERIANVSIGDVDDAASPSDPCLIDAQEFGPTVHTIAGQHYIDWPSMPLIPAYVVDTTGAASGTANACGADPGLGEVGLDFSMMAPLPHELQRPGEAGAGYTDLLGIAPGAQYSLYVPATTDGNVPTTAIVATMLAAATAPAGVRPDVITASLGFGNDTLGFPGRFFEEDPIVGSAVSAIVNGQNIVVCISANDGTRTYTPAAIGPAGGSAATTLIANSATPTALNDVEYTTIPSQVYDYGSIDVGGSTLNDTVLAPITDSANAAMKTQLAWPEVRWDGFGSFSSGFGSRVNVSAPSDNVLAISHSFDGVNTYDYDHVDVGLNGGTSASAPEVAATVAVLLQVAKLTGHPFTNPFAVRQFLIQTGHPLPNVPQADQQINVGPQIDIGNAVNTLLAQDGKHVAPAVPRVSITQRREVNRHGTAYFTDTSPWQIDLVGHAGDDRPQLEAITISPDWEGLPADAKFKLIVAGKPNVVLATTPFARLLPADIFQAAGLPLVASGQRTVQLEYIASAGLRAVSTSFSLVFGPADATIDGGTAPHVAPVTAGTTMSVSYDISHSRNVQSPTLVITEPGRMLPTQPSLGLFHMSYSVPLTQLKGTVQVPVSALQGAGVYGVAVQYSTVPYGGGTIPRYTNFAMTRVEQGSATKANPVTVSADGVTFSHFTALNYGDQYRVKWDVSNVPGASGALIEIGPSAPSVYGSFNTINNPNGSIRDNNGIDSPSVYTQMVSGTTGTIVLSSSSTLTPTLFNQVRVIPMNGAVAIGESSDTSMLAMNGFMPPDGNAIMAFTGGNGGVAEVTTFLNFGNTVLANGIFPFDMKTGTMGANAGEKYSSAGYYFFDFPVGTMTASSYQLFEELPLLSGSDVQAPGWPKFGVFQGTGTTGFDSWSSVPSGQSLFGAAYARETDTSLIALKSTSAATYSLTTMQLPNLTLGTQFDVTPAYTSSTIPQFGTSPLSFDPVLNEGLVEGGSGDYLSTDPCTAATSTHSVSTISLANGQIQSYPGAGHGIDTTSYDSVHHILASADACGNLTLYDMVAHTATTIALPIGYPPDMLSVDAKNGLVLVGDALDPSYLTNNDAQSAIFVYDERGNLQKALYSSMFLGFQLPLYMELDENTREVLVTDFSGTQIEPLTY